MSWTSVILSLCAAFLFAVAAIAQQQVASTTAESGAGFFKKLIRNPRWLAGIAGDTGGYILQAIALAVGALVVVLPILATSLLFALPLAARWSGRRIGRSELFWAAALTIALGIFLAAGDPLNGNDTAPFANWRLSLVTCAGIAVIAGGTALLKRGRARALGFAIVSGTLFGLASALTKSVMHYIDSGGTRLLSSWELYALVLVGLTGFATQQLAFQAGSLEVSLPAIAVLDPVIGSIIGIVTLQETLQAQGSEWIVIGVTIAVMVAGTLALARAGVPTQTIETGERTARPSPM